MIADWSPALHELQEELRAAGVRIPSSLYIDGKWHRVRGGAYLLTLQEPRMALYCVDGREPKLWRSDRRTLSHGQRMAIDLLVSKCPREPVARAPAPDATAAASYPLREYRGDLNGVGDPRLLRIHNVRPGTAVARALEMLDDLLAHGPVRSVEVRAHAKRASMSWATVRRAADVLPVCMMHLGYGGAGAWWWARGTVTPKQRSE